MTPRRDVLGDRDRAGSVLDTLQGSPVLAGDSRAVDLRRQREAAVLASFSELGIRAGQVESHRPGRGSRYVVIDDVELAPALRRAAMNHIEARLLADPDPGPKGIAADLNVSVRTLYRAFGQGGTSSVMRHVRERRLERARGSFSQHASPCPKSPPAGTSPTAAISAGRTRSDLPRLPPQAGGPQRVLDPGASGLPRGWPTARQAGGVRGGPAPQECPARCESGNSAAASIRSWSGEAPTGTSGFRFRAAPLPRHIPQVIRPALVSQMCSHVADASWSFSRDSCEAW